MCGGGGGGAHMHEAEEGHITIQHFSPRTFFTYTCTTLTMIVDGLSRIIVRFCVSRGSTGCG